jgi:hypothetical protein
MHFYCKRVIIAFEEIYAFLDKNIKARQMENLRFCGKQQERFMSQQPQDCKSFLDVLSFK